MDINNINGILNELIKTQPLLAKSANYSLNDIYKNISNPIDKYKNKS
jgi:hypothetical protein